MTAGRADRVLRCCSQTRAAGSSACAACRKRGGKCPCMGLFLRIARYPLPDGFAAPTKAPVPRRPPRWRPAQKYDEPAAELCSWFVLTDDPWRQCAGALVSSRTRRRRDPGTRGER